MKIVIINCHWDNRGDEAAIRAMIDELTERFPETHFYVQRALGTFVQFPISKNIELLPAFPSGKKKLLVDLLATVSKGKVCFSKESKAFFNALKNSCFVIHAPGGPSIGDIYLKQEKTKLWRLFIVNQSGVPYAFYAPSMGPFHNIIRNPLRKKILKDASLICLREELSKKYVQELLPDVNPIVTLDSAFQHGIDVESNKKLLDEYNELKEFLSTKNIVGITVTDLQWNSLYKGRNELVDLIRKSFSEFIDYLIEKGYKVLFIPQLFERSNDYDYMKTFERNGCFVMSDKYDCYFQQYVISLLKVVVGMRYHSNIFSAKMGTPFISVSYEQKMSGFMIKVGLSDYCIEINDLSTEALKAKFERVINEYANYKSELEQKGIQFKKEAYRTTQLIGDLIQQKEQTRM